MPAAPEAKAAAVALEAVMRQDRGRMLAGLIARLRDFQLAEEALQEAAMSALAHWGRSGLPVSPQGWLLRVALRKAIDRLRQGAREGRKVADLARLARDEAEETAPEAIPDERLQLIFTCCHPALDPKSRVALTLRTLGGLSTPEIARAFLDTETTMGQRLSRAKAKIRAAGIAYEVPGPDRWPERLASVLTVIYLIFNEGYARITGDGPPPVDLCNEAIWLGRMLAMLCPGEAEVQGLLALMLVTHARRGARTDARGHLAPLAEQDRALWDAAMADEGRDLLDQAMRMGQPGPMQIKAAISLLHLAPGPTDWRQIVLLYEALFVHEPTAVVRLNRAVALAEAGWPDDALRDLDLLSAVLEGYQPFHAARANLCERAGDPAGAVASYDRAIHLARTDAERQFLLDRRTGAASAAARSGTGDVRPNAPAACGHAGPEGAS